MSAITNELLIAQRAKTGYVEQIERSYDSYFMRALCAKEDVNEFEKIKDNINWFDIKNHRFPITTPFADGSVGKNVMSICLKCGRMDHFIGKKNKNGSLKLNYRAMTYRDRVLRLDGLYRLELEHWRLRNEKLIVCLSTYRLLDDRLMEQLFDKLLSVLPFEIAYSIMYSL